jgi:predicted amidohydrolase YtcJ
VPPILLRNATIHTMDGGTVPELLVAAGRVARAARRDPEAIDLGGACVIPGFTDSHVHFPTWAIAQRQVRLEGTATLEEAVARVVAGLPDVRDGGWLRGLGWRGGDWHPHAEPTRHDLDAVTGDVPVALMSRDYHSLWLNSAALARANGDLKVAGGVVELDANGEPTGVLREESAWRFRDRYAAPSREEFLDAMRAAMPVVAARGVTAVHDKDGWLGALSMWQDLRREGSLTTRVWQSVPWDRLPELESLGLHSGFGDDMLRVGYVKAFLDGTLGSRTAHLLDGSGVVITERDDFEDIVRRAARAGFPVAVHAIGDAANRIALDVFEATRDEWAPRGLRPRIEHAQLVAPEDVPRFAAIGVTASVQFSHAPSDRDLAEEIWAGATDRAYAYRSLLDAGARLVNGSDAPVEELDPLAGLVAGVLRTLDDRPAWHPEQAVGVEAALRAATVVPAWLTGDEDRRGRLRPGMLADLVVLDRDPLAIAPEELPEVRVVATMLGGRWISGRDSLPG